MSSTPPRLAKNTTPDLDGAFGRAWVHDIDGTLARHGNPRSTVPRDLTVAAWIVCAPYAHPFWSHYSVICVSLRDVPGCQPPVIRMAGATHEVIVHALNPEHEPAIDDYPRLLLPPNFVGQFIEPSDEAARERIRQTVQDVIDAKLNPDTDYTRHWIHRFSDSNIKGDPKRAGETRIVMQDKSGHTVGEVVIPPVPGPQD